MSSTIDLLRAIRTEHPDGDEILGAVRQWIRDYGDGDHGYCEMEIARALHWIGVLWHGGQWDVLYQCQCGGYSPGIGEGEPGSGDEDRCPGDDLYDEICATLESGAARRALTV